MTTTHMSVWLLLLILLQHCKVKAINVAGLEVTRYPEEEIISLDTDGRPLILSYIVCGSRHKLERFQFKVTVLQNGIGGGDVKPRLNAPLIRDATAEDHGISVSLWNITSPHYEMCNEVPIRVWTDDSELVKLTIELKLGIQVTRIPEVYRGGKFRLVRNLEQATTPMVTTPMVTNQASAKTESELPYSMVATSTINLPLKGKGSSKKPARQNEDDLVDCKCYCNEDKKDQY